MKYLLLILFICTTSSCTFSPQLHMHYEPRGGIEHEVLEGEENDNRITTTQPAISDMGTRQTSTRWMSDAGYLGIGGVIAGLTGVAMRMGVKK